MPGAARGENPVVRVARTELRLGARRFAFWFMAVLFAVIGGLYFTRFMSVSLGEDSLTQGVKLARNSPYSLAVLMGVLAFFFAHFTAALTVDPVLRDRRIGLLPLVLVSPIGGRSYLLGKFLGAAAAALLPPLSLVATVAIVQFVPNSMVGLIPPNLTGLAVGYLEFYLPLAIATAALVFALALTTGSPKLVYSLVTLLFIGYFVLLNLVQTLEHRWMAYLDPAGLLYLAEVVARGKTNAELNRLGWLTHPWFLANRALLLGGGLAALLLAARGFARREAMAGRGAARAVPAAAVPAAAVPAAAVLAAAVPAGGAISTPLRPLAAGLRLAVGPWRQLGRVTAAELRLLAHERSLFFLVPLLAVVLWTNMETSTGFFDAVPIPVSSQVARDTLFNLLVFLVGTTAFFVGETAFREREEGLADLVHAYPVPEIAFLGGKVLSNVVLSAILALVGAATAMVYQVTHDGGPVDLHPFLTLYGGILFPSLLILTTLSVCLAYLAGSKPGGYALLLGVVGVLFWAFIRDHRHWLYNLPAAGLFAYSDLVGLGPLRSAVVQQRLYVTALALVFFFAAAALYPRATAGGGRSWRRRRAFGPALAALAVAAVFGGILYARVENGEGGIGALATERLRARYETEVKPWLAGRAEPEFAGVDLELDLYPRAHGFALAADVRLRNTRQALIDSVHLTVNPRLLARGAMTIDGRPPDRYDCAVATFALPRPLAPGEEVRLACRWRGAVPDGLPRSSSALDTFIEPGASYLHSFAAWPWLPVAGYSSELEITSDRMRRRHGLPKRDTLPLDDGTGITPGFYYQSLPYPYRARIRVPDGEEVLSAGTRVARREAGGGRVEFEYVSDGPIYFFPVMAGRWVEAREGASAVHHAAAHPQNAGKILAALTASRAAFSDLFSPYPYQELRVAEFPRLATFAMGYPTLIPFSEAIGFLTRDPKKRANLNFYVTAHEVAHQWWGTVVWPAHAKGSPFLTESLANYSSLLMAAREEGEEKRRMLFEDFEDRYLRRRDANEERPLAVVDGDRRRDEVLWYDRGGIVLYMLHGLLGEERMLTGLREYIRRFSFQEDHPTMTDFIALYEGLYPETAPFFDQFIEGKAIPNPGFVRVAREKAGDEAWRVGFEIANRADGDLHLVVAASAGERDKEGWREARAVVALRGASPAAGEILCDFEPERIEMDPDRTVLLQERRQGRRDLE